MLDIDLKPLFERLSPAVRRAFEGAAGSSVAYGSDEVAIEHVLLKLLESPDGDLSRLLRHCELEPLRLETDLRHRVERARAPRPGKPVLAPMLVEWLQDAWLLGSLELGLDRIVALSLLAALCSRPSRYGQINGLRFVNTISIPALRAAAAALDGLETASDLAAAPPLSGGALEQYTLDFTERARSGSIDPVFGRETEIRRVIDILGRRRKNNPIAVGEPGVGKTALVEGLALKIIEGDVPEFLYDVRLLGLDLGLLQAGASVKGEFESRLRDVLGEINASPRPIILFIDEAHTLIGAGAGPGGSDAANLLKPPLARGELRTIAATTWSEYKKYFEKDAALARRFQPVALDEPSPAQAIRILRGLRPHYESAHDVYIRDDAVIAAAELSARYLAGRQLPDKAIDVLDTACARVRISLKTKPAAVDDHERRAVALEHELAAIARDSAAGLDTDADREQVLQDALEATASELETLNDRWASERSQVSELLALRDAPGDATPVLAITHARAAVKLLQNDVPLIQYEVGADEIAAVISDWTGIPLGRMVRDGAAGALALGTELAWRIKGQGEALGLIERRLRAARAGLRSPTAPMGVFLLVGPSGVGKTETALAVADRLFGGERFVCSINMSEFQEKHTVSRLIGSPPGYVGYGEGGVLTEAVRQRPYSVVLLDEVEKADREVMNLFYQVFDKGQLADGEGRIIDFRNTVIFMTSNLADDLITGFCDSAERPPAEVARKAIRPVLSAHFRPALLARMDVVPYYAIDSVALDAIVRLKLDTLALRMTETHGIDFRYDDQVVTTITARCHEVDTGARNVDAIIDGRLLPAIATELLTRMGEERMPLALEVSMDDSGEFTYRFHDPE